MCLSRLFLIYVGLVSSLSSQSNQTAGSEPLKLSFKFGTHLHICSAEKNVVIDIDPTKGTDLDFMCGIVGVLGVDDAIVDRGTLLQMSEVMRHRGPDDDGIWTNGSVGFAFRRLAILDLTSSGHQPMLSDDGQVVIVFNGEIYNYVELREELRALGHTFVSTGDTEVLLKAYLEWGSECLGRLNGMWAFLIWDGRRKLLVGSRDRVGQKPLFRYRLNDHVLIASEIKAILSSGYYRGGANWSSVAGLLLHGDLSSIPQGRQTFFEGIEHVPPGTWFEISPDGRLRETRYWQLPETNLAPLDDTPRSIRELLDDSVRLRKRSDVPVGVFLSGGLDSTALICSFNGVDSHGDDSGELYAFSFHSNEFDESRYVDETVRLTGARLVRHTPDVTAVWTQISDMLRFHDEPVHSFAAVATFELSRVAAEHGIKVILIGGGADEIFGGYPNYHTNAWYSLLRRGRVRQCWSEIQEFCSVHGGEPWTHFRLVAKLLRSELSRFGLYRQLATRRQQKTLADAPWYAPEISCRANEHHANFVSQTLDDTLRQSVTSDVPPKKRTVLDRGSSCLVLHWAQVIQM